MKKSRKSARKKLNPDENDLLSSFEKGEWKTVANVKKEKARARKAAAKTLRKDVRINIRLSSSDVMNIKQSKLLILCATLEVIINNLRCFAKSPEPYYDRYP
jgi:predicted DNA binding CopG/RHH family protein